MIISIYRYLSTIIVSYYKISINPNLQYSFSVDKVLVKPIQLDYINAILHEMEFSSPSVQIDDVPEGFSGFQFADVTLEMNIYNNYCYKCASMIYFIFDVFNLAKHIYIIHYCFFIWFWLFFII